MLSLLILLPVMILILGGLGIVILQQSRPSIGYSWLIASLTGLLVTILMLLLRWRLPLELVLEQWRPFGEISSPPAFILDLNSWAYAFCLVVLALAFILTDAARLETEAHPYNWAVGLGLTGIGLLAVMARNPTTLVVIWTAVDFIEILIVLSTEAGRRMGQQTVTTFSIRSAGSLLVVLAMLYARSQGISFALDPIPGELAIFMLLAVGLRLGVLPLNVLYAQEVYVRRGLGNLMRMIGPASSLMVLSRMPEQVVPVEWHPVFLGLCALAALYGAAMWLAADHELAGRLYWLIALAALAIASVINGNARASITWGTALLLVGSVLFFYSAYRRRNLFIPILAVIGITGLPFTPVAAGWSGVIGPVFNFYTFTFLSSVILLIWGFIRHSLRPREELHRMERWVHPVYPTGLVSLILAQWVIGVAGWPGSFSLGVWWAAGGVFILAGA
ncbi:MAG: hypothetical protein IH586_23950, partial [Anaerolineaceae bacterium]|nr:hypothetical protein [Anaerolineaceae bacterium]